MSKFKMMAKPKKPEKISRIEFQEFYYWTFVQLLETVDKLRKEHDLGYDDFTLEKGSDCIYLNYTICETDENFNLRMEEYNNQLKKYEKWLEANKEKIEELEKTEKLKEEEERRQKAYKKLLLLKEKENIERQLKQLED